MTIDQGNKQLHLMAYLKTGATSTHPGGWRHNQADLHDIFAPSRYEHIARVLEDAKFDGCFFADTLGIPDVYKDSFATYVACGGQLSYLDPMIVLPVMARVTRHLGLGATLSTTFHQPYHLARILSSLDHFSGGRACWNVVTSTMDFEARNFGMNRLPEPEERYDRGDEVVEACCALWECWAPDALVMDKASGLFAHPDKVTYANYQGRYVKTRGPMTMPRSPQGRPVLMQAGSSPRGRAFAARWAEAIFCTMQGVAEARSFYQDIKARMVAFGRAPNTCQILPAISVVVGETESIAMEKADYLHSLTDPELALATTSAMVGADISRAHTVAELDAARGHQGHGGIVDRIQQRMRAENLSFAEAARKQKSLLVGTPSMIADRMEEMFIAGACDGFVVQGNVTPAMFEEFGRMVVPELQRRGIYRQAYRHSMMRDNLRDDGSERDR
jgi:FMN-dependent oxidoreductase (nitrilotriacetate monooxygenase family)